MLFVVPEEFAAAVGAFGDEDVACCVRRGHPAARKVEEYLPRTGGCVRSYAVDGIRVARHDAREEGIEAVTIVSGLTRSINIFPGLRLCPCGQHAAAHHQDGRQQKVLDCSHMMIRISWLSGCKGRRRRAEATYLFFGGCCGKCCSPREIL